MKKVRDFQGLTLEDNITNIVYSNDYDFTASVPTFEGRDYFVSCCVDNINNKLGDMSDFVVDYDATLDDVDAYVLEMANLSADFVYDE